MKKHPANTKGIIQQSHWNSTYDVYGPTTYANSIPVTIKSCMSEPLVENINNFHLNLCILLVLSAYPRHHDFRRLRFHQYTLSELSSRNPLPYLVTICRHIFEQQMKSLPVIHKIRQKILCLTEESIFFQFCRPMVQQ
jgi:hypothetical protein